MTDRVQHLAKQGARSSLALCILTVTTFTLYQWGSVNFYAPLPGDSLQVSAGRADERTCIECHVQAEQFHATGHANALSRSTSTDSLTLLAEFERCDPAGSEGTAVDVRAALPRAENSSDSSASQISLDWCFGSGRNARTWVATLSDSQGATEGTVANETAEAIADITSSGETLRANHLKVLNLSLALIFER